MVQAIHNFMDLVGAHQAIHLAPATGDYRLDYRGGKHLAAMDDRQLPTDVGRGDGFKPLCARIRETDFNFPSAIRIEINPGLGDDGVVEQDLAREAQPVMAGNGGQPICRLG